MTGDVTVGQLVLGVVLVTLAIGAMFAKTRRLMVLLFLGFGATLTCIWAVVGSPDVALAEAALGAGVLGAFLVAMVTRHPQRHPEAEVDRSPPRTLALLSLAALASATLIVGSSAALAAALEDSPLWEQAVRDNVTDAGFEHGVTAVLLNFRAYDTLLESFAIMLTAIVVLAIVHRADAATEGATHAAPGGAMDAASGAGKEPARSAPSEQRASRPPTTFQWLVRLAAPAVLVLAGWVLFAGTDQAGGAFQSGAITAGLLILLHHADVGLQLRLPRWLAPMIGIGVVVFAASGVLGVLTGAAWLEYDPSWVSGVLIGVEILLTVGIASALFAVYLCLAPEQSSAFLRYTLRDER